MTQVYRENVTPVTLGVTFAGCQKNEEKWPELARRGPRNSEPVESVSI